MALPDAVNAHASPSGPRPRDFDRRLQHARIGHLRRHRALPDQLVDAQFVGVEIPLEVLRRQPEVGRADRLVRFLRVLHAGLIAARARVVLLAEHLADDARRLVQRLVAERGRIRPVIGDEALDLAAANLHALEQPLRDLHRPLRREAELAAGFLRERGGGERRRRAFDARLRLDRGHLPGQVPEQPCGERLRSALIEQADIGVGERARARVEVLARGEPHVADARERGRELASLTRQPGLEVPVAARPERPARLFAFHQQPHRHALHAAGAQPGGHLLPQHRRQRVAVEPVEDAAALLRLDQVLVEVVRARHGLFDRLLGDFVEDDPSHRDPGLQDLPQVPADRLAFAVRVGGQQELGRLLHGGFEGRHLLLLVRGHDVIRGEVAIGVHRHPAPRLLADLGRHLGRFLRQIANVAVTGLDAVRVAEKTRQRLRLGRRLDYHQRFRHVFPGSSTFSLP